MIASLFIVHRVANRSALTSLAVTTGHADSFNVRKQGEPTGGDGAPLGGYGKAPGGLLVGVETTTDLHPDGEA